MSQHVYPSICPSCGTNGSYVDGSCVSCGVAVTATGTDPKGAAGRKKDQLQLIPPAFNAETARALAYGADRYGPWNWRRSKVEVMTYIGAIRRHMDAFLSGEDTDESGAHHLGHVAASCAIVLDALSAGTLVDNRPGKEAL